MASSSFGAIFSRLDRSVAQIAEQCILDFILMDSSVASFYCAETSDFLCLRQSLGIVDNMP